MLKQNLGQKQLQKLSPQQIQLMKLLQVPTASLEQRVKEELEINPALDEGKDEEDDFLNDGKEEEEPEAAADDFNIEDYISDDDYEVGSYALSSNKQNITDSRRNYFPRLFGRAVGHGQPIGPRKENSLTTNRFY